MDKDRKNDETLNTNEEMHLFTYERDYRRKLPEIYAYTILNTFTAYFELPISFSRLR